MFLPCEILRKVMRLLLDKVITMLLPVLKLHCITLLIMAVDYCSSVLPSEVKQRTAREINQMAICSPNEKQNFLCAEWIQIHRGAVSLGRTPLPFQSNI